MPCKPFKELYQLCKKNSLKLGTLDVIRLACKTCTTKEVCPSVFTEEYESQGDPTQNITYDNL